MRRIPNIVEPEIRTIAEIISMADRTMGELFQEPTEGDVSNDVIKLMLFPYSLEDRARIWDVVSKTDDRIDKLADQISNLVEIVNKQVITPAKAVEKTCVTCGGAHAYYECIVTDSNPSSVCAATGSYNQVSPPNRASHQIPPPGFAPMQNNPNRFNQNQNNQGYRAQMNNASNFQNQGFQNQPFSVPNNQIPPSVRNEFSIVIKSMQNQINVLRGDFNKLEENLRRNLNDDMRNILSSFFQNQPSTSGTLSSNTVPNSKGEMKAVTTRSGLAYEGPSIPTESPLEKVDEQNTEEILDKEHSNSSRSTAQIQPLVVPISILETDVSRTQSKPTIPYPSWSNDQKLREKATNQMEKFFQIFHDLHFDISFADALLLMLKFASTIKSLLANKDKLFELAKVPLNENCSAMLLKKLPEKLGDPELTPTRMTLELVDRSITRPKRVTEDVFVKVGKLHFPTDFIVVDFKADPRVPLILGRSFLRTGHALIDVYGEEITLRVNDESITFNLDQVMKYSNNSVSRVNVINIASEEVVQDNSKSSNPTLVYESNFCEDPIVKTSPFGESDFFSEEIENFLKDDSIQIENFVFDPEGDILLIEKLLNEDPCQLPPMNFNQVKSLIEEPEYSFSMGYEHFITTLATESNEVVESSDKNLVPILREHEVTSDNESEYNESINDDSFLAFTTFTNPLFNDNDDFTSNDNESIHDKDEEFKVYSNLFFDDDEIYSDELELHCSNVESTFVESLSNHDTLKFDHLGEFSRVLMPIHIADEERIRKEHTKYISLMERLITINPYPRPMVNATIVESLPLYLIPIQDNDSQREEINIVTNTDELLPLGFENDDSEGEIDILEELRVDNSISNSENELSGKEASDFDNPSFPGPLLELPDAEFDLEPDYGELISAVMNNIEEIYDELECLNPGEEFDISTNDEDDDYFPFIHTPYRTYSRVACFLCQSERLFPFPSHLYDDCCNEKKGSCGIKYLDAYSIRTTLLDDAIPPKEKDPGSFTLPSYINNLCSNKALADLGASISVMPFSTYINLCLGKLAPTNLIVELTDRTVKHPKGIAENKLVGIDKFFFPVDFIVLDMPEDIKTPLILGRPFLFTTHAKIDVFKRKITLRVRNDKFMFKSEKPTSNIVKRVYVLSLRERIGLDLKVRLIGEALILTR
nr:hypothetical protein [Tanacetum cinerariifolium]